MLDEEIERLGPDDIPGQRYDLAASVELLSRAPSVRGRTPGPARRSRRPISSAVTSRSSARATASRTRSALIARTAWSRASSRKPRLVPALALQHLLERQPAPLGALAWPARRGARSRRRSATPAGRRRRVSIIACSTRSRTIAVGLALLQLVRASRAGRRAARRACRTPDAVFAKSSSASGSLLALTSFTSTAEGRPAAPPSPREPLGRASSVTFEDRRRACLPSELLVELRAELAGPDAVQVVGPGERARPPRRRRVARMSIDDEVVLGRTGRSAGSSSANRSRSRSIHSSISSSDTASSGA